MINGTDGRAHHHVRRSYGAHAGPFCPVRLLRKWLDVAGITEARCSGSPKVASASAVGSPGRPTTTS